MMYFKRYAYPTRFIDTPIQDDTLISVVIPIYNEPDILTPFKSLYDCHKPKHKVEIIAVLNYSESDSVEVKHQTEKTYNELMHFIENSENEWLKTFLIKAYNLPAKKAGVGLARKIGMDEAAYRFNSLQTDGIIACFDADSSCSPNYFRAIENGFTGANKNVKAASIHFEHPLYIDGKLNWPIIYYELHLRYYILSLLYANYPFSFHTIGSSMAVRSSTYQSSGGMNTRKAGEDFYFLHKLMPLGDYISITDTQITPSARESERVPFGTGKAIKSHLNKEKLLGYTYDFRIFEELKQFFQLLLATSEIANIPPKINQFLQSEKLVNELTSIHKNSKNKTHFRKVFFNWFNGFKVLKCVHFLKNNYYADVKITNAVNSLITNFDQMNVDEISDNALEQLHYFRKFDKDLNYRI